MRRLSTAPKPVAWAPQPGPQTEAILADWCDELFYGGAAGGGKSDFLLGDFLQDVPTYGRYWQGVLFRRTYNELEDLLRRSRELFPASSAVWHEQAKTWTWPNGASLRMRYIERDADATRYQGHAYTWIGWDELTQWPSDYGYRFLRARLRSAHEVPTKRIRAAANPGGVGHHWVKAYFVDPAPGGYTRIKDPVTSTTRMFVPARLVDNKILLSADPTYADRLRGLASDAMVRAWLDGDWTVIEGAYFDCWRYDLHVVEPFEVPRDWARFRSMDWGSAKPFSVGWWTIVPDDYRAPKGRLIPRGALVRYREWYGAAGINVGLKMTAEQVAEGIVKRETTGNAPYSATGNAPSAGPAPEPLRYAVLDPACFREDGGPSIAERLNRTLVGARARPFHAADNSRVPQRGSMGGWDQLRARLVGQDGLPMIYCFSTHSASIRTIPALQHDASRPEDVNTESEDHCFAVGTLVKTDRGEVPIEALPATGKVLSIGGFVDYRSARMTRRGARVIRLEFSDGKAVVCTPDHRFLTDQGWYEARNLKERSCQLLSATQFKSLTENDIICAADTFKIREDDFIKLFGSSTMKIFREVIIFITRIITQVITILKISSVLLLKSILASIIDQNRLWPIPLTMLPQLNGIDLWKDIHGIKSTTKRTLGQLWTAEFQRNVLNVTKTISLAQRGYIRENTVAEPARLMRCVNVEEAGIADVYCLTVPTKGCFVIESGLVVSNCADEWRYACMSRPFSPVIQKVTPAAKVGYTHRVSKAPGDWIAY